MTRALGAIMIRPKIIRTIDARLVGHKCLAVCQPVKSRKGQLHDMLPDSFGKVVAHTAGWVKHEDSSDVGIVSHSDLSDGETGKAVCRSVTCLPAPRPASHLAHRNFVYLTPPQCLVAYIPVAKAPELLFNPATNGRKHSCIWKASRIMNCASRLPRGPHVLSQQSLRSLGSR